MEGEGKDIKLKQASNRDKTLLTSTEFKVLSNFSDFCLSVYMETKERNLWTFFCLFINDPLLCDV